MADRFFIRVRGRVQGPLTTEQIQRLAHRGRFGRHHEVSEDGSTWSRAHEYPDLFTARTGPKTRQGPVATPESDPIQLVEDPEPQPASAPVESNTYGLVQSTQPEPEPEPPMDEPSEWFYSINSDQSGPVPLSQLQFLASTGQLQSSDLVWKDGMAEWTEAVEVPEIFATMAETAQTTQEETGGGGSALLASGGKTSTMALVSLILGLLGTNLLFVLGSIVAIVFGHLALAEIKQNPDTISGRNLALAGLVLGYAVVILAAISGVVLLFLWVFGSISGGSPPAS